MSKLKKSNLTAEKSPRSEGQNFFQNEQFSSSNLNIEFSHIGSIVSLLNSPEYKIKVIF